MWFGCVVKSNGGAGICCEIGEMLPEEYNVLTKEVCEFVESPVFITARQEMISGKEPPQCWRCFDREKHGTSSLRQTLNTFYILNNGYFDTNKIEIQNVEIVFGDLCQLSCVMCHPLRSRKVIDSFNHIVKTDFRDTYKLDNHMLANNVLCDTSWTENKEVWDNILPQLLTTKRLFLNGGEPLLATYHNYLLEYLINNNVAKNIELIYSTNLLLLNDTHLKLWSNFKTVNVAISVDDLHERNNFIRYPTTWEKLEEKINQIYQLKFVENTLPNVNFSIWCAVNMLSFFYLTEFLTYFHKTFPLLPIQGLRGIQTPVFLNPNVMPLSIRTPVIDELLFFIETNKYNMHLKNDLNFFTGADENILYMKDGIRFLEMTAEYRNINIHTRFEKSFNRISMI